MLRRPENMPVLCRKFPRLWLACVANHLCGPTNRGVTGRCVSYPAMTAEKVDLPVIEVRQDTAAASWSLIKRVSGNWLDDYVPSMGAALAFYTMFSLAPLLLIVISVAGLVFGEDAARGEIQAELQSMMGDTGAKAVQDLLASVQQPVEGVAATLLGIVLLLVGATTVFGELQDSLDRIWHVPTRKRHTGIFELLRTRLLSFGMILAIGFLLIVSLVVSAGLATVGKLWGQVFDAWYLVAAVTDALGGFLMVTLMFALIYKTMPSVRVQWRDVWVGAMFTAILFMAGKWLIGLYIGRSSVVSGFGAAGSLVVVLLWVYYSAQIFLMGAEFTWVYANVHGSRKHLNEQASTPG